jgi:hypothetical protein
MTTYRNARTGEIHTPEPGSWLAERIAALPDIWQPVDATPAEPGAPLAIPAKTARKSEWVDYAMSRGYTRTDAESLTRDDLARLFDDDETDEG